MSNNKHLPVGDLFCLRRLCLGATPRSTRSSEEMLRKEKSRGGLKRSVGPLATLLDDDEDRSMPPGENDFGGEASEVSRRWSEKQH
jgi:hypothetical protein